VITNNDSPLPAAPRFRTRPVAPQPLSVADSQKQLDTYAADGLVLAPAQSEAATKTLMSCCSLLGQPVTLKPVKFLANPNPSYEERKAQEKVSRRLLPKLPSFNDVRGQFSAALAKAPRPLAKAVELQLRHNLASVLSAFVQLEKDRQLGVLAAANAKAAQAQSEADARERAAAAELQKAKARQIQLSKLASEQAEYEKAYVQPTQ
jgi:hypothetical protein